jgi:hypothetical protein
MLPRRVLDADAPEVVRRRRGGGGVSEQQIVARFGRGREQHLATPEPAEPLEVCPSFFSETVEELEVADIETIVRRPTSVG